MKKDRLVQLEKLELKVNKSIEIFQRKQNKFTLETLIQLNSFILQWKTILIIYKYGLPRKEIPNNWLEIESKLDKLYGKVIQQEPLLIRTELLKTEAMACNLLESQVDGILKSLTLNEQNNKFLEDD